MAVNKMTEMDNLIFQFPASDFHSVLFQELFNSGAKFN